MTCPFQRLLFKLCKTRANGEQRWREVNRWRRIDFIALHICRRMRSDELALTVG